MLQHEIQYPSNINLCAIYFQRQHYCTEHLKEPWNEHQNKPGDELFPFSCQFIKNQIIPYPIKKTRSGSLEHRLVNTEKPCQLPLLLFLYMRWVILRPNGNNSMIFFRSEKFCDTNNWFALQLSKVYPCCRIIELPLALDFMEWAYFKGESGLVG